MVTSLCIFIILYYGLIPEVIPASTTPTLKVSRTIQALGEDVPVEVSNVEVGGTVELFYRKQSEPINAQIITKSNEVLVFNCGYFFQVGPYHFKLKSRAGSYLPPHKKVTAADYPKIVLKWPKNHKTLTSDVKVEIEGKLCNSDIVRRNKFGLQLRSVKLNNQGGTLKKNFSLPSSSEVLLPPYCVLPGDTFNSAGYYRVDLTVTSSRGDDVILAKSDRLKVDWSRDYNLRFSKNPFPCPETGVAVTLSTPPYASQIDQIHLLYASNGTMTTIFSKLKGNEDHVTFPCRVFQGINAVVEGFCIQYITESGHVTRTICEPSEPDSDFNIAGAWSEWTEWSTCQRPCRNSIERRKRICNNPAARGQGKLCEEIKGQRGEQELMFVEGREISDECIVTSQSGGRCGCGCFVKLDDRGEIVSSLGNDCDVATPSLWPVTAPAGKVIRFHLRFAQLADDEVLTIHDDDLSHRMTSDFAYVTSRGNGATVQFVRSKESLNLNSCGFVLGLELTEAPSTILRGIITSPTVVQTGDDVIDWIQSTVSRNPVVVAGIGACGVTIIIVVVVVVVRKRRKGKRRTPFGLRTPMNSRLAMPPDGRSCSNADDNESDPMMRPRPVGTSDKAVPSSEATQIGTTTAYYLAQRQLEIMKHLGKNQHSQTYATGHLTEEAIRNQEELLFGDRKSLHKNEDLRVT